MTMIIGRSARTAAPSVALRGPQDTPAPAVAGRCYAALSVAGRLTVLDAATSATGGFPNLRRTGTAYRIDLDGGLSCWLDGEDQDGSGELNWAATHICTALSRQPFTDPWDAPFVCGPVLFTGTGTDRGWPGALTDTQLARLVDTYTSRDPDPDDADRDEPEFDQDSAYDPEWAR
jgi:hypothetical protein